MSFSIDQFETPSESEIVRDRLREVCPPTHMGDMDSDEVEKAVNVAFKIIGYIPIDLSESIRRSYELTTADYLCDFVFDVWRCDNGIQH